MERGPASAESQGKVYVVDDDATMRQLTRQLLESVKLKVEVFESAEAFLERYDADAPGCLIADFRMPGMSGSALTELLQQEKIAIPVILMTAFGTVQTAVRAMRAGAVDFIEKPFKENELIDRVQEALRKDRERRRQRARTGEIQERLDSLSPREKEVLDMVVEGWLNKQIAQELGISDKTVEVHRANLMRKLQAESVAELVRMVMLVRPGDDSRG